MEELTEVITAAEFHPHQCNTFVYSSSKGTIRLCDMRTSALCDKHSKRESPNHPSSTETGGLNAVFTQQHFDYPKGGKKSEFKQSSQFSYPVLVINVAHTHRYISTQSDRTESERIDRTNITQNTNWH